MSHNSDPPTPLPWSCAFAFMAGAIVLVSANVSHAFCRTTTCDPTVEDCPPEPGSSCVTKGKPLFWKHPCVGFSLQQDASHQVTFDTFAEVARKSFSAWTSARCDQGKPPGLQLWDLGPVSCHAAEYNKVAGNANIIMFRDDAWPYHNTIDTLALTTVTYNPETGEIYDADIEVNTAQAQFTTTEQGAKYDLQGILTHEIGHFLGLAHSDVKAATMFPSYQQGELTLRDLDPDDEHGICAVFPPRDIPKDCDATPRHGFQSTCGDRPAPTPAPQGCCASSVAPASANHGYSLFGACSAVLALLFLRRRRRA